MRMLCVVAPGLLCSSPLSLSFSSPKHHLKLPSSSFRPYSRKSPIKMSTTTIEHIVLFKVKDNTDPTEVNTMLTSLNALVSLDPVLHLAAAPLYRTKSSPIPFTHMLHSRYSSRDDLNAYTVHPSHLTAVKESVLPICDDIMAVDWVADDLQGPIVLPPGSAIRVIFLKLKENLGEEVKDEILALIKGIKGSFGEINQITCGENFSPARAKGYSIASLAVFPGVSGIEAVDSKEELVNLQREKVWLHNKKEEITLSQVQLI
ncbi:stress-response A/B barrel domain-containing protein UP3 isoform X2 [Hevea brasiliensis]|uniref:stress-response A/B barrel domain-containing protein UP3 isoform X2 n=1 Tax=Hevea brasiliensis TaxID=3981 RepID=UPI0025F818F5|nr:stress-response A/B barrel domain-containing protein UP3 isoform X2 [Hevea brasiliensis]